MNTSLEANNNKFYTMQILTDKANHSTSLFIRYGRVGESGVISHSTDSVEVLKKTYEKKFREKSNPRKGYLPISVKTAEDKERARQIDTSSTEASQGSTKYAESRLDP
jgi:predicted DNA-binding WGR domain protein